MAEIEQELNIKDMETSSVDDGGRKTVALNLHVEHVQTGNHWWQSLHLTKHNLRELLELLRFTSKQEGYD